MEAEASEEMKATLDVEVNAEATAQANAKVNVEMDVRVKCGSGATVKAEGAEPMKKKGN